MAGRRPEGERKMTVPLDADAQQDIREMDARGVPRTRISRGAGRIADSSDIVV